MRILAVADVEDDCLIAHLSQVGMRWYDLVVSCGDLDVSYLDCVVTMANAPLLYVRGNHDVGYDECPPLGGTDIDGRIVVMGGLRFAGLEGSLRYREGIVGYSQREMLFRAKRLELLAQAKGGVDVLVTHVPPRGCGDLADMPHWGFEAFNGLLARLSPHLMLHGHVHLNYGRIERERTHPSGVRLVNAFGWYTAEI